MAHKNIISEKDIEQRLIDEIKRLGGVCIKLQPNFNNGLPDRLCLLPGGRMFFAELKRPGGELTRLQALTAEGLRRLGVTVYVVDSFEAVAEVIKKETK